MSARVKHICVVVCDACGAEADFDRNNTTETRIAASAAGWKYRQINISTPGRGGPRRVARDACPNCEIPEVPA